MKAHRRAPFSAATSATYSATISNIAMHPTNFDRCDGDCGRSKALSNLVDKRQVA